MKRILNETVIALKNGMKPFTVWLICLPINFLPTLFKNLSNNEVNVSSYSVYMVLMGILKDSDFVFVFVAALCTLYIQTQWEWDKNRKFDKTCKVFLLFVLGLYFLEYIIIRFFPQFKEEVFDNYCIEHSIVLLLTVLVFGLVVHTAIAYYKNREAKQ